MASFRIFIDCHSLGVWITTEICQNTWTHCSAELNRHYISVGISDIIWNVSHFIIKWLQVKEVRTSDVLALELNISNFCRVFLICFSSLDLVDL